MIVVEAVELPPIEPPTPVEPPYIEPRIGLGVQLLGGDGSTWDMYDGPVRLLAGTSGFGPAAPAHRFRESAQLDGASWRGMRTPPKDVTLPVYVHTPDSIGWRDVDAAFFDAIQPAQECRLAVSTPDGLTRSIGLRYADGGDVDFDVDPLLLRYGAYVLKMTAADPYWRGEQVRVRFQVSEPQPMFPGPPFRITPATALSTAVVANPGDVAAWPRWTVRGPFTSFKVGVGTSVVTWSRSTPVPAGDAVVIDMDPRRRSIQFLDGTDAWDQVTALDFVAIPAGAEVPLALDVTGGGSGTAVDLEFTPGYRRAW